MEISKRPHRFLDQPRGQRKTRDARDHRHAPRAPPRESRSRSPTPSGKADEGPPGDQEGNHDGFVMSWLQQAYPHRNQPPDLENDGTPSVVEKERPRKKKRPRSPAASVSPSPENHATKRDSFEKRPRHKTRHDKYDYKDEPDRDNEQPRDRRKIDSRKRQQDEREQTSSTQKPLPTRNTGKRRLAIKAVAHQAPDSEPRDDHGTSLEPQEKPSRARRPKESKKQRKKFDKDIQDISGFFGRKSDGHVVRTQSPLRRQPRTPERKEDLSDNSRSHSSSPNIDEPKRRPRPPGAPRGERHTRRVRSISRPSVNSTRNTANDRMESSDEPTADLTERTNHGRKRATRPSRDRDRRPISSKRRERSRDAEPRGHEDRRLYDDWPTTPYDVNATVPLEAYGDQYYHSQRPLIDGRYGLMDQGQTPRGWPPGPSVGLAHGPTEWLPVQRGTGAPPLDHGYSQNWQMSRTRSLGHGDMLGNVDMPYFAQVTPTGFGPYLERRHSLGAAFTHDATYSLAEPPLVPINYIHAAGEPRNPVSDFYSGQSHLPMFEQANGPAASYDPGPQGASSGFPPGHFDRYIAAPRPSKTLKRRRRREGFVENLEHETLEALNPITCNDADWMEFQNEESQRISIQPAQDFPGGRPGDGAGADLVFQEENERGTTDAAHLSHVSSSILPLTHGFTHLAGPPAPKDVRMSFYGID